ncbi:MAG: flagellar hook-length control protein FliK, partial [Treponema sp.]|nr:flagellar hook-length control protein FliK [Treponema sp.]
TPALAENARERGDAEGVKSGELKSLKENARAKEEEAETEAAELLLAAELQIPEKTVLTGSPDEAANTGEDFHEMALESGAGEGSGSEGGALLARTGEETGDPRALQETHAGSAEEALSRSSPSKTESAGNKAEEPAPRASPAGGEGAEAPLNPAASNAVLASKPREQGHKPSGEGRREEGERTGETRKGDRRKDRLNLELRDFRTTRKGNEQAAPEALENSRSGGDREPKFGRETEITVDLKSQARSQGEISFERENRPQVSFRNMLARELHENLNGDIVRHASIMLKDGGEGIIRLSLRPEHLGNVKIRLEMTENKIAGRIIVESNEALRAFEQEIGSLEQAFRDSGFDGASLEMSVASGGGQDGKGRQREGEEASGRQPGPYFSERLMAASYGGNSNADGLFWFNGAYGQSLSQINFLV